MQGVGLLGIDIIGLSEAELNRRNRAASPALADPEGSTRAGIML